MPPIEAILEENERLLGQVSTMEQQMAAMQARIEWLTRQVFGAGKSEKFDRSQLLLELEELTVAVAATEAPTETISYERQKPRHKGREVPAEHFADVPVKEAVEIIPEEVKADPQLYEKIGQEETFEIDVTPPKLFKRLFIRPKYRHRIDRARPPVIAPAMKRPLEGSYASAGLLAWIMLSKYVDHRVPRAAIGKMASDCCATTQLMRESKAPRDRLTGRGPKSPLAAAVKSRGRERRRKRPDVRSGQMTDREMNESEPSMTCRNVYQSWSKPGGSDCPGTSMGAACIVARVASGMKVA